MSNFKKPHEISIWEDRLTLVDDEGREYDGSSIIPGDAKIVTSYFKEVKLCTIGSHDMSTPIATFNKELKREATGMNTLTFSIYSKYYDEEKEELLDNPYLPFLVNERKVKLKYYKNDEIQWLDFLIKNITENSSDYSYTYTATDLFINELSKSGFNLEFSTELENNQGTISELGGKIIQGTDWKISEDSETIQQLQEEALYELILNKEIIAFNLENNEQLRIPRGKIIYAFYSSIMNKNNNFFQFLYNENGEYLTDDRRVIYNSTNYYILLEDNMDYSNFAESVKYTSQYRGERLVRSQLTTYDPVTEKHVVVYEDERKNKIYGYSKDEYISENLVLSYITNGSEYVSTSGWKQNNNKLLKLQTFPEFKISTYNTERQTFLTYEQTENNVLFNSGFKDNLSLIGNVLYGDQYLFRTRCKVQKEGQMENPQDVRFKVQIKTYEYSTSGQFEEDTSKDLILFEGKTEDSGKLDPDGYFITRVPLTCKIQLTEEELKKKNIGIFINVVDQYGLTREGTYYFEDVQLFKYVLDDDSRVCLPKGLTINLNENNENIEEGVQAYTITNYYYYYPDANAVKEQIEYLYIGPDSKKYPVKYNQNFEKIRSITQKESNRFNLLQTLSETFECWCCIDVKHKETGEILLGKDLQELYIIDAGTSNTVMEGAQVYSAGNSNTREDFIIKSSGTPSEFYRQQKFISFHKNIGQRNEAGLKYGVNLKNIQRVQESEEIVSKLIVKTNNNEFAEGGGCNIAREAENQTGENFIINFDYYANQGLLNYDNLYNDLYSLNTEQGWLGYYATLRNINDEISDIRVILNQLSAEVIKCESEHTVALAEFEATSESLKECEEYFYELTLYTYDNIPKDSSWLDDEKIIALSNEIVRLRTKTQSLKEEEGRKLSILERTRQLVDEQNELFNMQIAEKRKINEKFEKKYSRFIQEGSWSSEDYIDDNLYYLDADSVLYNSSRPKVAYEVDFLELSVLEGFENYSFDVRDITYIQDPEFFGWVYKDGVKTPYNEQVVITEIVTYFDEVDKGKVRIQNYKSTFDSLFQRLTATTQKLEFSAGSYQRAANIITPEGNVQSKFLEDALSHNSSILKNAKNQSVTWDDKGITTINTSNPAEIVRITSGGVFLTEDGGEKWITGISGRGINAKTITTGQLDTQLITITNGTQTSFRWDSLGISAYYKNNNEYNNKTFVRFDQFGLYGIKNLDNPELLSSEKVIWDKAEFALTWKGFMLKSSNNNGYVSIDSEHDFGVYDSNGNQLIQIGRLDIDNDKNYGILIYGEQDENGKKLPFLKATQEEFLVGGWRVDKEGFHSMPDSINKFSLYTNKLLVPYTLFEGLEKPVNITKDECTRDDWAIVAGNQFGVTYNGEMFANNVHIIGNVNTSGGNLAAWEVVPEGFKYAGIVPDKEYYIEQYITRTGMAMNVFTSETKDFDKFSHKIIINDQGLTYGTKYDGSANKIITWEQLFEAVLPNKT